MVTSSTFMRRVLLTVALTTAVASCAGDDSARPPATAPPTAPVTDPSVVRAPTTTTDPTTTSGPMTSRPSPPTTGVTTTTPAGVDNVIPAIVEQELRTAGRDWMLDIDYPDQPAGVPWPTVAWPTAPLPDGVDGAVVQAIVDEAFRSRGVDGGTVDALLAVSGGQLVLEAYNGWDPAAPHPSWSMAKSVTHALIGVLVAEGRIDPAAPAPVPEWADPADPRHAITVDQLLRMRSGLAWEEEYGEVSDVVTMLFGEGRADRGHYAAAKPVRTPPDSTFAYSTGTSMILARIIADQVGAGETGIAWAQAALFDPLGITTVDHDLDGVGTISGGSNIDMSAQDFARFGLLYLRGGAWDGRQLLPQTWIDAGRLPRADAPEYGAHWWVDDGAGRQRVSFRADGFAGQLIIVVPSLDLVVVALANTQDGRSDAAAQALVEAFDPAS